MILYRCSLRKWGNDLTGTGASLYGGRWNSPGTFLIYTAENNVLAAFEVALRIPLDHISKNYVMMPLEVPDKSEVIEPVLPRSWHLKQESTKAAGENFIKEGKALLMKVPSALISDSFNYLINPKHPMIKHVKALPAKPILFDQRLQELMRGRS